MRVFALAASLLFGCSTVAKPEAQPANPAAGASGAEAPVVEAPAPAPTPEPTPAPEPAPVAERPVGGEAPVAEPVAEEPPAADPCGGKCRAPEQCLTYSGMQRGSVRSGCWISCAQDEKCPKGRECVMRHDGPGRVCVKK